MAKRRVGGGCSELLEEVIEHHLKLSRVEWRSLKHWELWRRSEDSLHRRLVGTDDRLKRNYTFN